MSKAYHAAAYLVWGHLAGFAAKAYFLAPRNFIAEEIFNMHKHALFKAHTHRTKMEV